MDCNSVCFSVNYIFSSGVKKRIWFKLLLPCPLFLLIFTSALSLSHSFLFLFLLFLSNLSVSSFPHLSLSLPLFFFTSFFLSSFSISFIFLLSISLSFFPSLFSRFFSLYNISFPSFCCFTFYFLCTTFTFGNKRESQFFFISQLLILSFTIVLF
jgi:hypothetical protein